MRDEPNLVIFFLIVFFTAGPTHCGLTQTQVHKGIWISIAEIGKLPTSGPAWLNLKMASFKPTTSPNLSDQNDLTNVHVLAKALVFARTGERRFKSEVEQSCMAAIGTERGGRTLSLGRELCAYVLAADLVGLPPEKDVKFRDWLKGVLRKNLSGRTLQSTHEDRPNNWGTHAGASRAAVAVYLGDLEELERTARVFKGYLGDRESHSGFKYGRLTWQADERKPVGINPSGATKNGFSIDGVMPDDMRRGGDLRFPPEKTGYPWEGLQGALMQAEILHRAGFDTWNWENKALLRAAKFLYSIDWEPIGDDTWQPHIINFYYGTDFPAPTPSKPGKNVGWTDWTHGPGRRAVKPAAAP